MHSCDSKLSIVLTWHSSDKHVLRQRVVLGRSAQPLQTASQARLPSPSHRDSATVGFQILVKLKTVSVQTVFKRNSQFFSLKMWGQGRYTSAAAWSLRLCSGSWLVSQAGQLASPARPDGLPSPSRQLSSAAQRALASFLRSARYVQSTSPSTLEGQAVWLAQPQPQRLGNRRIFQLEKF